MSDPHRVDPSPTSQPQPARPEQPAPRTAPLPVAGTVVPAGAAAAAGARVRLSEVLNALSRALDLTEGQPAGHSERSCLIGMRMGRELGLDAATMSALHYALLLKDAGCSSNAARMSALFGSDDRWIKPRMKIVDWHQRAGLAIQTWRNVGQGLPLREKMRQFMTLAQTDDVTRDLIAVRCERGATIATGLGFPSATASAIRSLDEHWCGAGHPEGLARDAIPLLSRIANLAQTMEVAHARGGAPAAIAIARARRGRWFDPALVDLVTRWKRDAAWWEQLRAHAEAGVPHAEEPPELVHLADDAALDGVARAFADIIDAKSPYTYRHSSNVADFAAGIARAMELGPVAERRLLRAGLLHDVGKLGVSSRVLDKPGKLTDEERSEIELHPRHSWEILSRVEAFSDFAWMASVHHEKLDGTGYPWGLGAADLDAPARVLAVADIYEALTADRPYRAGMTPERALAIITGDVAKGKLCADALAGLEAWLGGAGGVPAVAASAPAIRS